MPADLCINPDGISLALQAGVNEITDASILAALGRQMTQSVTRQSVAASNLANIDTPGYKTREATFSSALDAEMSTVSEPVLQEVPNLATKRDGNNVQLDRELLALNNSASDFSAAQTALSAKFRLVRYAINEGR